MSGVTILPCPPSFYEGYIPQLARLLTRCIETGAELGFVIPVSPKEAHAHWMRFYSNVMMKQSVVFLALDDLTQELLACVILTLAWQPNAPHRADVLKLLVDPSVRGRGISTRLMRTLEDYARSLGRTLLILDAKQGSNAEAIFSKWGWIKVGKIPNFAYTVDQSAMIVDTIFYKQI